MIIIDPHNLLGQSAFELQRVKSLGFIDRFDLNVGFASNYPNDNSWDDHLLKSSNGKIIYESKERSGLIVGMGITHDLSKILSFNGRVSYERSKYFESYVTLDNMGNEYAKSFTDQVNDYLVLSCLPIIAVNRLKGFQVFTGLSLSMLVKSISVGETFVNGQYYNGARINTFDGFEKYILNYVAGIRYSIQTKPKLEYYVSIQGNYGLTKTIAQDNYRINVSSLSFSLGANFIRKQPQVK